MFAVEEGLSQADAEKRVQINEVRGHQQTYCAERPANVGQANGTHGRF